MPISMSEFSDLQSIATRVMQRCDLLAQYSEEEGRLTRTFCSPAMRAAHAALRQWMNEAKMVSRTDAVGNLTGRFGRDDKQVKKFLIGSHLDTVRNAGKYDGILGVLLGLAVVEALNQNAIDLPFALEVVAFSDEEGTRFNIPFLGSLALIGRFDRAFLDEMDRDGVRMADAIRSFGQNPDIIPDAACDPSQLLGYFEAHIEQGPILEKKQLPVGVVHSISGQTRAEMSFEGVSGHAGTTPMDMRRDALAGAAEFVTKVENIARNTPLLVATVGQLDVEPNVSNVIPGKVRLTTDVRHHDDDVRQSAMQQLLSAARNIGGDRQLIFGVERCDEKPTVEMDKDLTQLLATCVADLGHHVERMTSGAGHDAQVMSEIVPAAMLFIQCRGGISHHPDESVKTADVHVALQVMLKFILELAHKHRRL
jgi:allantoate deiminase